MTAPADSADILAHLFELMQGVSGLRGVWRNRGDIQELLNEAPAAILLDGDETPAFEMEQVARLKSVKMVAAPFVLTPQVWVIMRRRDDLTNLTLNGQPDPVGDEIQSWKTKMRAAIENDQGLIDLLGPNGQMIYAGYETDMKTRSTIGALGAQLMLRYQLRYISFPPRS